MKKTRVSLERPTLQRIRDAVAEIAGQFSPDKIILFGSYSYGEPMQDSDVDLLVIMKTEQRPVEQATAIRQAMDFPFPVDLLVRTPEQVEERLTMGDCFIKEVINQGKVLYEAHHKGMDGKSRRRLPGGQARTKGQTVRLSWQLERT